MMAALILSLTFSTLLINTWAYSGEFVPKSYYVIDSDGHQSDVVYFRGKREVDLSPLLRLKRGGGAQSGASASAMASASASSTSGGSGAGNPGGYPSGGSYGGQPSPYGASGGSYGGQPSTYGTGGGSAPNAHQQSFAGSGSLPADAASLNLMLQKFLKSLFDAASQQSNFVSSGPAGSGGAGAYSHSFSSSSGGGGSGGGGFPAGFPGIPDFSGFAGGFGNGIPDYAQQYHGPILFSRSGEDTGNGVKVSGSAQGPNGAFSSSSSSVDSTGKVKYSVQSGKY